jgi:ABC-type transporter MlaC component
MHKIIKILFFLYIFNITAINSQDLNNNKPEIAMNNLISLFKSYHKAVKGEQLTIEKENENKKTALNIEKLFHFDSLIQGALQDQWKNMTKAQQNNFYDKFKKLIELIAYPQGSYFYNNSKNEFKKPILENNRARIASDNYNYAKDIQITITYIFEDFKGSWMLVDVEMNEHILVDAYRLQVNRYVAKNGLDGLMEVLNKKYDEAIQNK